MFVCCWLSLSHGGRRLMPTGHKLGRAVRARGCDCAPQAPKKKKKEEDHRRTSRQL